MRFSNVRLLVKDFAKCFKFYTEQLGLEPAWREKLMVSFSVDNVDETFTALKAKGVTFISEPTDMPDWGMRTLYLRDPEENLIELFTPLAVEQFSQELLEEDKKF